LLAAKIKKGFAAPSRSSGTPDVPESAAPRKGCQIGSHGTAKRLKDRKDCILLVPLGAGNGFKKIPLPAPHFPCPRKQRLLALVTDVPYRSS